MGDPILDLSTLDPDRPPIKIDGKLYHLAVQDDFGPRDFAYLSRAGTKVQELAAKENLSDEEADEIEEFLSRAVSMLVPDADDEIISKLRFGQKVKIVLTFGNVASQKTKDETEATETEPGSQPTGESSSQGSSDSTEDPIQQRG